MTYRVKNIGIAVVLAAFAGLLTIFYVASYKRHVQHGESKVSVLVAARDIPAGTTGAEVVEQHYLKTETVPRRTVVPGAISSPDQLNHLVVTDKIFRGEQVTTVRFGTPTQLGVRAQLKGSERALQMAGDANELLAGTLQEGDHVDVVATWPDPEGSPHHFGKVIARDLLVLTAPIAPSGGAKLGEGTQDFSVQLRATDAIMQKVYWARQNGEVSLLLRPPADAQNSHRTIDDARTEEERGWPH
jgi:Flp pilus assembly protein CpaB